MSVRVGRTKFSEYYCSQAYINNAFTVDNVDNSVNNTAINENYVERFFLTTKDYSLHILICPPQKFLSKGAKNARPGRITSI